jgi:hypothetical protein
MLCVFVVVVAVLLAIISVVMRFAVVLANKCLGGSAPRYDDYDDDDWDSYERPARRDRRSAAIPEPNFLKGMGIAFVAYIVNFIVNVGLALALGVGIAGLARGGGVRGGADPGLMILFQVVNLAVSFLVWSGILAAMLPTTFGRAALVTLFMAIIGFFLILLIVVPLVVLAVAVG